LGIPYVLLVRNSQGWRFWVYLAIGSGIGPSLVLSPSLYAFLRRSFDGPPSTDDYYTACIATMVSCLTALVYLLLLRRAQSWQVARSSISDGRE
jgi:hypothetical protein